MKKSTLYITGIVVLMATSCTDENLINEATSFRIMGGMDVASRTTFINDGNTTHTHWVADDAIGLFSDTQSNLKYTATTSGATTEFVVADEQQNLQRVDEAKVYAYYPYTNFYSEDAVRLPDTQEQNSENPPITFLYSEATVNGNELHLGFKHLYAYLRLTIDSKSYRHIIPNDENNYKIDGIYISSDKYVSTSIDATFNVKTHKIQGNCYQYIKYRHPSIDLDKDSSYTYFIPILPISENAKINISIFYTSEANPSSISYREISNKVPPKGGFKAGHVYTLSTNSDDVEIVEMQLKALSDLYQATGGDDWYNNDNWLSEKPFREWYGLNSGIFNPNCVSSMDLSNNNLTGSLPPSFATLMDNLTEVNLNGNHLNGMIPDEVKAHERWNQLGWNIIQQSYGEAGFDLNNSRLIPENVTINNLLETEQTMLHDIFSKNKLTQIILLPQKDELTLFFDTKRVNLHLDYQSKGLGTLIFTAADTGVNNDELCSFITSQYGEIPGVKWIYGYPPFSPISHWGSYIFDAYGQLTYMMPYRGGAGSDNTEEHKALTDFFRTYLGEPDTSHPEFNLDFYTSTDYSRDGEIFNLHKSTVGKGIDLVFMGDGFVDKDMEPGGKYEQKMKEAFDKLFSIEPYISLKDRFNAYGVKVVSPNAEWTADAKHRIDMNIAVALELAQGIPMEHPKVIVVYNTDVIVDRSRCYMDNDGTFVAFNMTKIDNSLIHEAGGHGLGHLADEYVEGGYEELTLPDAKKYELDEKITLLTGFCANVDYNATPSTVRWAHLLADERFDGEDLDIYEGAYLYGYGAFRPSENSMMRYNIGWFNAPSRESIYKAIMSQSVGEGWTYNYEDFVAFDQPARTESRSLSKPLTDNEKREILERHCPPIMIQGDWRDLLKHKNGNIVVPMR